MSDLKVILEDFIDSLYGTENLSTMFSAFEQAVKALGFDYISYTYIPGIILNANASCSPIFQLSDGYDSRFIQHYAEANFAEHDYTIKAILNRDMRIKNWWDDVEVLDKQEKTVIDVARHDYGIKNGVTIPTYGDGFNVSGVSVSSTDGSNSFSLLYQENIDFIRKISQIYSDRVIGVASAKSVFERPFLDQLTQTEKLVLSRLAEGCNVQAIAADIQRDYKYIANRVLPSIRGKMGNVSRDRMMYLAGNIFIDKIEELIKE